MVTVTPVLTVVGRGRLPFASLHGEALVRHGARSLLALAAAHDRVRPPLVAVAHDDLDEVERAVAGLEVAVVVAESAYAATGAVLLHDPLCPLVDADLLGRVVDAGLDSGSVTGRAVAAYRPVTDTLKTVERGRIEGTVDRETLAALVSPVFVPADRPGPVPLGGFAEVVAWLRSAGEVHLVRAPAIARRVDDESAVNLLECVDEVGRRVRTEAHLASRA